MLSSSGKFWKMVSREVEGITEISILIYTLSADKLRLVR